MRIDRTRTTDAKARTMSRRQYRRDKSARLFLAIAFPPVSGFASVEG
jgi:hypothetical protein